MTHKDHGHYAKKHPKGTIYNPQIAEAIKQKVSNYNITCAAIHKISEDFKVSPPEVGTVADLLEIRLIKCQLGLFGYAKKKKIIEKQENISHKLEKKIKESIISDRISCLSCWEIAKKNGCSKLDVSNACETLNIKISLCQLGAF